MYTPQDTSHYDYHLPPERIAHTPAEPRDSSKLLVVHRKEQSLSHHTFRDIIDFLSPGDLLVLNDSKVFKCRLHGTVNGKTVELFLLREENNAWQALAKPGRILGAHSKIDLPGGVTATVIAKKSDGTITVTFPFGKGSVFAYTEAHGEVPLPPYISNGGNTEQSYQTTYAREVGSVAVPTAGLHFTPELLQKLTEKGVHVAYLTLHVGLGTFQPIKTEILSEHAMHTEYFEIPEATKKLIEATKHSGKKVVAVGTTSLRALESWAEGKESSTNLFITPGYQFKTVDALITNFHLPASTLLVLVRTFGGDELLIRAYEEAIKENYRFYSFGDAMLIL